jgi:hypothetical protein
VAIADEAGPMPKQRTEQEQRAYDKRVKQLKQSLEHELSQPESTLTLTEAERDHRLSSQDLKILSTVIEFE